MKPQDWKTGIITIRFQNRLQFPKLPLKKTNQYLALLFLKIFIQKWARNQLQDKVNSLSLKNYSAGLIFIPKRNNPGFFFFFSLTTCHALLE